jgi:cysteine-S-conjugate beta-lyase
MAQIAGLNRRAFLRNAGLTAVAGAVSSNVPLAAAAETALAATGSFDFDTPLNRVGTDCSKWDRPMAQYGVKKLVAGMGIADMDFKAAPCITKALVDRLQHENWGYLTMPASHVESMVSWNKKRYGLDIKPETIVHSPSLHPAILSILRVFSPPGTKVIVQSPTYNAFYTDIRQVGCKAEENRLKLLGDGRYQMDFEDLERRIGYDTHTLILCNPQNPTGNVWTKQDLTTLGEICLKRRVLVLADEIHCDFVMKGQKYVPFASLDNEAVVRNSFTLKSASKSFNLAAMKCAYFFSTNPDLIARVKAAGHKEDVSTLGMVAHRAAYTDGADWMDQLISYIDGNHEFVESYIKQNIPLIKYVKQQGTYLAWIDVSGVMDKIGAQATAADATKKLAPGAAPVTPSAVVERYFVEKAQVYMNAGIGYGAGGENRMRMNIGTSRKTLEAALASLATACRNT